MSQRDFFDEPIPMADDRPVLLPIQMDLLTRGRAVYAGGIRRAIWQGPCGSGKTVVAAEQTRRALEAEATVLHIVHRRRLVDQMTWTLGKFSIAAAPIMEGRNTWNAPVRCASRDTLLAMLKDGQELPRAKLIIWDECHIAAKQIQSWYLKNCPDSYWTGYTASPVCPDGRSLNPPYEKLVCMAPASELIRIGRLCRVKVYNPDAVGQRRRKGEKVKPVGDPIAHWKKYALDLPTVVFAANVKDSRYIAERYCQAGISAEHIDASTPEDDREAVFERSKAGVTRIICNCGVLIEGVDLPWLVCCQILRGCNSLVLWVQANGRIMRTYPGKEFGITLDHAGAAHEFGMPDADFEWSLEDEAANAKRNKPPKDRKPVVCPACGFVFLRKPACPECGKVMPYKHRKSLLETVKGDGVLTEFNGQQNGHIKRDVFARLFKKCFFITRARGGLMSWTIPMFSKAAGIPPWEADLPFHLPRGPEWKTPAKEWHL